ncbi:WavE lipopolysaccharide synthesis family protein [Enterobacter sp. WCHEn045836]|uniref:WavE lipopolysaccharide synthesis family protein n=1 Tax=Enterobacter sp. WCHEn045836 TaxID=2497434 RepID=UPI00163A9156|nr:WavE lipopolysaccharide synthesis family protein [Enterobacter sp. WCHEn045836]
MVINNKDISVIIQGPIVSSTCRHSSSSTTQACIDSVRSLLPGATVILSTWEGQEVPVHGYDHLILNQDPGHQNHNGSILNNVNRQIVSTMAGLMNASSTYCLKIRSDVVLRSTDFLNFFCVSDDDYSQYKILRARIVSNNLTSRDPKSYFNNGFKIKLLFHISDHVHFGFRSDLLAVWDLPLQTKDEALYFLDRAFPEQFKCKEYSRYAPEQYIMLGFLRKYRKVDFEHYAHWSAELEFISEQYMLSNFIFLDDYRYSFSFEKYHTRHERKFRKIRYNEHANLEQLVTFPIEKENRQPKISVVIAAYKTLPHIKETIESILNQDYPPYEVIIVRNGSYVDDLEDAYFQDVSGIAGIKILKVCEANASLARRQGVQHASGDYIYIMDADDLLSKNALALVAENIKSYAADCIVLGYKVFREHNGNVKIIGGRIPDIGMAKLSEYRCGTTAEALKYLSGYNHTLWCFVFRKGTLLAEHIFPEIKYYEEIPTLLYNFIKSESVSFIPAYVYFYRQGTSTQLTHQWGDVNREEKVGNLAEVIARCLSIADDQSLHIKKYLLSKLLNVSYTEAFFMKGESGQILYRKIVAAFSEKSLRDYMSYAGTKNLLRLVLLMYFPRCISLNAIRIIQLPKRLLSGSRKVILLMVRRGSGKA